MPLILLSAFIGVPLLEIAVFIQVGGLIGLWPTLGTVILTAVAGTFLLRAQGLATLNRARTQMDAGQLPARELFDGLCLLFAGALLLTPGFVTDGFGLLLFVPAFRDMLRNFFSRRVVGQGQTRVWMGGREYRPGRQPRGGPRNRPSGGDGIIDGEYEDVTPGPDDRRLDDGEEPQGGGEGRGGDRDDRSPGDRTSGDRP